MALTNDRKKYLRSLGHKLNPVVTVAGKGLSESVLAEIDRALNDHELIKVKLAVGERELKKPVIDGICQQLNAEAVQTIGHIVLLFRAAKKPDPKLSNLLR
jgi:RNA-binding protein